jgi:hypothetical protein
MKRDLKKSSYSGEFSVISKPISFSKLSDEILLDHITLQCRLNTSPDGILNSKSIVSSGKISTAVSVITFIPFSEKFSIVASYWFDDKKFDNNTTLMESCLPMPYYDMVLTVIWLTDPPFDSSGYDGDSEKEFRYEESPWRWSDPKE